MKAIRNTIPFNENWIFTDNSGLETAICLPHTWNAEDGTRDYYRGTCQYRKEFHQPEYDAETQRVYLQFYGVNSSAIVTINGVEVMRHDGGYSTFRKDITEELKENNVLIVSVDNSPNDHVYPQKADFTFFGGIYRDVELLIVNQFHFDLDSFSGPGIQVIAKPVEDYEKGLVTIETRPNIEGDVVVSIFDAEGIEVSSGSGLKAELTIPNVHLWNGRKDPYLYTAVASLSVNGIICDEVRTRFGVREFHYHPKTGFYLNGRSYPLHGVSRHQDYRGLGNAIGKAQHIEDMNIICDMGANTIRLSHYQHDPFFYDLCDERGMVVWAEIPYISEHLPNGRENTISQMSELITQNFNHASIVCWGISNEITISTKNKRDMLDNHHVLNDLCHKMDPTRFTTLACYAMCGPFNRSAHITDVVSWNLYLGWYVPGLWLNDAWIWFFHTVYPNRCLGYSEYGCEGMPNLHSSHPRRGDHTEEYQAKYHEYMLRCFERHPYMWATHVWTMFDFVSAMRNQGGEPGMNHKGLVTADRKILKDSFYLYKAWWSDDPFVHLCSKRFVDRTEDKITVKVYSNQNEVTLYVNGDKFETKKGNHVFTFLVPMSDTVTVKAVSGEYSDEAVFRKVSTPNPDYVLKDCGDKGANWTNNG